MVHVKSDLARHYTMRCGTVEIALNVPLPLQTQINMPKAHQPIVEARTNHQPPPIPVLRLHITPVVHTLVLLEFGQDLE